MLLQTLTPETIPRNADSGHDQRLPGQDLMEVSNQVRGLTIGEMTYTVGSMQVFQPPQLPRDSNSQATQDTSILVVLVHVPARSGRGGLPVVNGLIPSVFVTDKHKAPSTDPGMVHADYAHA
jgi:hypothetical protein